MAAAAILKIHLNGRNSVTIARIRTKFGPETKADVPQTEIPPNLTSAKIPDGGRLPFKQEAQLLLGDCAMRKHAKDC